MLIQHTQNLTPFDSDLNDAIIAITGQLIREFEVADTAPSTYKTLKAHLDAGHTLTAARKGSENTIFGAPEVNYAFRAWHDWSHWRGEFDFSLYGECATCSLQIGHLRSFFGVNEQTDAWARLLTAEICGQRQYFEKHQIYVKDQRAFARAYLANPNLALTRHW